MVRRIEIDLDARIETEAVQFGDDWPGVFVRGDDCIVLVSVLKFYLRHSSPTAINGRLLSTRLLKATRDAIGGWQPPPEDDGRDVERRQTADAPGVGGVAPGD